MPPPQVSPASCSKGQPSRRPLQALAAASHNITRSQCLDVRCEPDCYALCSTVLDKCVTGVTLGVQEERGERRRQALAAAAKDAKLTQVRRNMQALEAKLIQALQADAHRLVSLRPCSAGIARGIWTVCWTALPTACHCYMLKEEPRTPLSLESFCGIVCAKFLSTPLQAMQADAHPVRCAFTTVGQCCIACNTFIGFHHT